MRKETFANGEYYHICNRGIEGRNIILDSDDADRFITCLEEFNTHEPIGSLYLLSFQTNRPKSNKKLVDIVAYCLNPNHFHLVLCQKKEGGISQFIKRLTGGYSWYFNKKNRRKGTLFQGPFRAKHIRDNEYLLHVSTYVNLNNKVHQLSDRVAKLVRSSWEQYQGKRAGICKTEIILSQFKSKREYLEYAKQTLPEMIAKRADYAELKEILLED